MKTVFFGTPQFAIAPLKKLANSCHSIAAVVTQPDRAKDRKGNLLHTPVKQEADKLSLPVFQFDSIKKEGVQLLKSLDADVFITAAYGQILSQEILDIPKFGAINVHASLLPLYRGSSPVQQAILDGKSQTGVTIMQTRLGVDTGEIILQEALPIYPDEDSASLMDRLSVLGADLLLRALDSIKSGTAVLTAQDQSKATYCSKITRDLRQINWNNSAQEIHNQVRAIGGATVLGNKNIKIISTKPLMQTKDTPVQNRLIGQILDSERLIVACGIGELEVIKLVPQGARPMSGKDFLRGIKKESVLRFE